MSKLSKKKIAITGTIGSGKSTATKIISKYYKTISSDAIVSDLYKNKDLIEIINKEILKIESNILDKKKLSEAIFNNVELRRQLEAIVHPLVRESITKWLKDNKGILFVEVPLLYEANFDDLFDLVILVVADQNIILDRLAKDRGYSKKDSLSRIKNQYSTKEKMQRADYIIYNNEDYKNLRVNVKNTLRKIEKGE